MFVKIGPENKTILNIKNVILVGLQHPEENLFAVTNAFPGWDTRYFGA